MNQSTTVLRQALRRADMHRVRDVIDCLERPWAPERNDSLRGLWHAARRDRAAQPALADAIASEVQSLDTLSGARDVAYLARRLDLACASVDGIALEIARRVGASTRVAEPLADVVVSAVHTALDIARVVLREDRARRPRGRRRYRRGL